MKKGWDKESCQIEALKYKTRTVFSTKSTSAYNYARKNDLLDEICKHMHKAFRWTLEKCKEEAQKYKSRRAFQSHSVGAFNAAVRNGWLEEVHGQFKLEWSLKECKEEASKYKTRLKFLHGSGEAFRFAQNKGWIDEVCEHIQKVMSFEECKAYASKFKTPTKFKYGSHKAHYYAKRYGWIDKLFPDVKTKKQPRGKADTLATFKIRLKNRKFKLYDYVSGFEGLNKKALFKCNSCGQEIEIIATQVFSLTGKTCRHTKAKFKKVGGKILETDLLKLTDTDIKFAQLKSRIIAKKYNINCLMFRKLWVDGCRGKELIDKLGEEG